MTTEASPLAAYDDDALIDRRQVAALLGATTRVLDQMIAAGKYPRADVRIGMGSKGRPRWRLATHRQWVRGRSGSPAAEGRGTSPDLPGQTKMF